MVHELGLDLRVARKHAALTQADCAHMVGIGQPRISKFEAAKATPSVVELAILHLLFGQPLSRTSEGIIAVRRDELMGRLVTIPDCPENWRDSKRRFKTLSDVAEKLAAINPELYD